MDWPNFIADSQIHIWAANSPERPWPADRAGYIHGPLSFEAPDVLAAMDAAGVDRAVLIPPYCEGDRNDVAIAAAKAHPTRFAVMGRFGVDDASAPAEIRRAFLAGEIKGVRLIFAEGDARYLTDGTAQWLWELAEALSLPVMLIAPGLLPEVGAIARTHPKARFAIDHLGFPLSDSGAEAAAKNLRDLLSLADVENVSVKTSGLAYFPGEVYPLPSFLHRTRQVLDAFGAQRVFWGSDMTRLAFPYEKVVGVMNDVFPFRDRQERDLVMGLALCRWLRWSS